MFHVTPPSLEHCSRMERNDQPKPAVPFLRRITAPDQKIHNVVRPTFKGGRNNAISGPDNQAKDKGIFIDGRRIGARIQISTK